MIADIKCALREYTQGMDIINYEVGNKNNALREYLINLDVDIMDYSNKDLKKYIENNSNISFAKNKSKGKVFVNYNSFRKAAGELRTRQRLSESIQSFFDKLKTKTKYSQNIEELIKKDNILEAEAKEYAKNFEDENILLNEARENAKRLEEFIAQENRELGDLEENQAREDAKRLEEFIAQENRELGQRDLENLVKASNIYTGKDKIVILKASTEQLNTAINYRHSSNMKKLMKNLNYLPPKEQDAAASRLIVLSDGKNMVLGSCDANLDFRTDNPTLISIDKESVFDNIIKLECYDLYKKASVYTPKTIISALEENYALAQAGTPNNNFEELLNKHSKLN